MSVKIEPVNKLNNEEIEVILKNNQSMRNANIRVSAINKTQKGEVCYSLEDIKEILEKWSEKSAITYYLIEHAEDVENIHYHIVIQFKNPTKKSIVINKFPYSNIEKSKSVKNSIQYLVHLNDPQKYQHNWSDIVTNSTDLNKYMLKSKISEELDINYFLSEIDKGNIKHHNLYNMVPIEVYSKHKTRLLNALEHYVQRICQDSNRKIDVEFYYGDSGTGKTTYAKYKCVEQNLSVCISSSSNDPLQDYKGEDVLVLDDLRDDSFKFDDILKILDNHTRSSVKSRYNNKQFIGQKIIITSTIPLYDWYKHDRKFEEIHQLHRRVKYLFNFKGDKIDRRYYEEYSKKYIKFDTIINYYYLTREYQFDEIECYFKKQSLVK